MLITLPQADSRWRKDSTYVIDAFDQEGRHIEHTMEYLIRSTPDLPPEISVHMPGRDLKVMALEEVSIGGHGQG